MSRFKISSFLPAFLLVLTAACAHAQIKTLPGSNTAVTTASPKVSPRTVALGGLSSLAKFEPERGCYVGAFIELDHIVKGKIADFENLTHKKHASYFTYCGYGMPFPKAWVDKVKAAGGAPQIAFEPNNGLDEVADDAYLRAWARDAARSRVPIFLRWASEMNGPWIAWHKDPAMYIEKFRLVSEVMSAEAPNVAMVWTPFAEPQRLIAQFYPGDQWVDWVGMNIYSVYVNNGDISRPAYDKDPVEWLRFLYDNYPNKPIHISEFASTFRCKGSNMDTVEFGIEKMTRFYNAIKDEFPRVKSVNWFCWDTITGKKTNNNYSFLTDSRALKAYNKLVGNDYFLSNVVYDPSKWNKTIKGDTTIGPLGKAIRPGVSVDKALEDASAMLIGLSEPVLRGLTDGDIIKGDLSLRAQLPIGMEAKGLLWQIDGRTVAITNTKPYRVYIPLERLGPGEHKARVVAMDAKTFSQTASPEVSFELVE